MDANRGTLFLYVFTGRILIVEEESMFPGILLSPLFWITGAFWAFGPAWSWIPFNVAFWVLTVVTLLAGPGKIAATAPMASQSTSSTFSLAMLLAVGIAVALLFYGRYWEIALCAAVFLISGQLWPRLRTLGRM